MKTTDPQTIIQRLEAKIAEDYRPIDREERFDQMLDECYDFAKVGGPFAHMSPANVLKECDPTAYRCGVNDFADGENWVEVAGDTYDRDDAEKAQAELVDELEGDIADIEAQIEELEAEDAENEMPEEGETNAAEILGLTSRLETMRGTLAELERYSF